MSLFVQVFVIFEITPVFHIVYNTELTGGFKALLYTVRLFFPNRKSEVKTEDIIIWHSDLLGGSFLDNRKPY